MNAASWDEKAGVGGDNNWNSSRNFLRESFYAPTRVRYVTIKPYTWHEFVGSENVLIKRTNFNPLSESNRRLAPAYTSVRLRACSRIFACRRYPVAFRWSSFTSEGAKQSDHVNDCPFTKYYLIHYRAVSSDVLNWKISENSIIRRVVYLLTFLLNRRYIYA